MNKKNYIKPELEAFELPHGLNILNSVSLGANVYDWIEDEDEHWGEFIPYE